MGFSLAFIKEKGVGSDGFRVYPHKKELLWSLWVVKLGTSLRTRVLDQLAVRF